MRVETTALEGVLVLSGEAGSDERGFFVRTFDADLASEHGIDARSFAQDSQSRSRRGVVRGLHGRSGRGEAKLVRVAHGAVLDVVVDARPGSATFGRWITTLLDDVDFRHLYVPPGFLHGHQTLTETADVCYRIDRDHDPSEDIAAHYADPDLAIPWPQPVTVVSDRDAAAGSWAALVGQLHA